MRHPKSTAKMEWKSLKNKNSKGNVEMSLVHQPFGAIEAPFGSLNNRHSVLLGLRSYVTG